MNPEAMTGVATVLFACVHNAGRSQMAAALFDALADPLRARAHSAGTRPAAAVQPEVIAAMRDRPGPVGRAAEASDGRRTRVIACHTALGRSLSWVHYELVGPGPLLELVRLVLRLVEGDEQVRNDARVAQALRKIPLETFCSRDFDRKAGGAAAIIPARRRRLRSAGTRRQTWARQRPA